MLSKPKHSSQAWSLCFNNAKKCDETLLNWGFRDPDIQLPCFFGMGESWLETQLAVQIYLYICEARGNGLNAQTTQCAEEQLYLISSKYEHSITYCLLTLGSALEQTGVEASPYKCSYKEVKTKH